MRIHNITLLIALFTLICSANISYAQIHKSCGHDHAQIQHFGSQEAYDQIRNEALENRALQPLGSSGQMSNDALTIPVVFHIIHDGEPIGTGKNISDGQVIAQLNSLNDDFTSTNSNFSNETRPSWDAVKGSPLISFCLATVDPLGAATTGIVRHNIEITGEDSNNNNIESVKAMINWDPALYMNVYVLSVPGTNAQGGVVGWAYLPYFGTVGFPVDGIVVDYNWFGGPGYSQTGNKTLTHETGHYLGLFHTFNGNSCSSDDGLGDTPNISAATSSLDASLNCGNAMNPYPTAPTTCGNEHMYINYMDYVNDDDCPTAFSVDQALLMRGVLEGTDPTWESRAALVGSTNTACAGGTICDLYASTSFTGLSCNSTSDGTATVTATDGTAPYTYAWSTSPVQTNATATGLSEGTYFVTVTDVSGCDVTVSAVIPDHAPLSLQMQSQGISAPNAEDGTASVSISGGTLPYSYAWNNGGSTSTINNLAADTYDVTVTDANNCTATASVEVDDFDCQPFDIIYDAIDLACNGGPSEFIIWNVNSTGPFTYLWNTGATTSSISLNSGGLYSATVTDGIGCTSSISANISEPDAISIDVDKQDVTQLGGSDGQITLSVSGGYGSYSYMWDDGPTTAIRTGLIPGTYSATIFDSNNCSESVSVTISEVTCGEITINPTTIDESCFGASDGSINLNIQTISAPYTVDWSSGGSTDAIDNLSAGNYTVTLTDADGCTLNQSFTVSEPIALFLSIDYSDETANQANDGTADITVVGGVAPYTYSWNHGPTVEDVSNLAPGTYTIIVTDSNNCTSDLSVTIEAYVCPSFDISGFDVVDNACYGGAIGSASVNVFGGTAPYGYDWSTGDGDQIIRLLTAGTYQVTVTDEKNCTVSGSATVSDPSELVVNPTINHVSAVGTMDGAISLSISGGTGSYTTSWSNGETTTSLTNLAEGTYTYSISDANGCTTSDDIVIEQYVCPQLSIAIEITPVSCRGSADGSLMASTTGGTAPYTYQWSTGANAVSVSELPAESYLVVSTDSKGCIAQGSATIVEPELLTNTTNIVDESGNETEDGQASVVIAGGVGPYTVIWGDGGTGMDRSGLAPGTYSFEILDANGCALGGTVTINAFVCPDIQAMVTVVNNECTEGGIDVEVIDGTAPYSYVIDSDIYETDSIRGLTSGSYEVQVIDANGCEDIVSFAIDSPAELILDNISTEDASGILPGSASVEVSGGVEPYTYLWSDGRTNADNYALFTGIHSVMITDAQGCTISAEVIIHLVEESNELETLLLFETHPNPATNQVRLQAEFDEPTFMRIVITSLGGGNPVYQDELETDVYNESVDVSRFAPGIYSVTIFTEDGVETTSLVKL